MAEEVLHSVSYAGVWPGQAALSLDDFLIKARDLGFPAVMLMAKRPHLSLLDHNDDACLRIRERLDGLGLRCVVLAGYTNFSADREHPDIPHWEYQVHVIARQARMAELLGAPTLRIFTAYSHPSLPYAQLAHLLTGWLREAARRAAPHGVTLAVQNHHDFAADWRSLGDLLAAVNEPNCRAAFDAWAPALHKEDLAQAARAMAHWTVHTTVADYQLRPRFRYVPDQVNYQPELSYVQAVPMGTGFIDYSGFLRALAEGGYEGPVAYEMCSPLLGGGEIANLDRYAGKFLDWMKSQPVIQPNRQQKPSGASPVSS